MYFWYIFIGGISSVPSGAGKRIIIIDIGSKDGFLGCGRAFIGKKGSLDYHDEMNAQHFEDWLGEVLEKIPDHSVIVIDQASYHRRVTDATKNPTSNWRKADIISWLHRNNIDVPEPFEKFEDATLPVLRQLCKENKVKQKFVAEEMVESSGKDLTLLWLPVAHCELNAIELIWAHVKSKYYIFL